MSKFWKDFIERVFWTAVAGTAALVSTTQFNVPPEAAVVIAAAVTGVKSVAAKHVGNTDSASLTKTV